MIPRITVVGSIRADLSMWVKRHPHPGETVLGTGGTISPGGKGANQAVAAALQGAGVAFVGAIGNDAYAFNATALMVDAGVVMTGVEKRGDATGLAVITVAEDGENTTVVLPGANSWVTESYVNLHADIVRNAEIVLLQGEIPASGFEAAVRHSVGRVVVNLAPVIPVARELLFRADPLLANEHEAARLLEYLGCPSAGVPDIVSQPERMAQELLDAGFRSVVITLGPQGAMVATEDGVEHVPTPPVTPVDTTGAGDAFTGALVARLAEGSSLRDAAFHACRVAAYTVTGYGAQSSYPAANDPLPEL
ncbi:ribokinase [Corynebacterium sp.]|uniref:ribokinase n=1 Tax=Corynebacterium sp. TaxID=1720 RepID=UPI0026DB6953|nr:ribokinase [Corynebacterium sp.]MDO5075898.1 ribokinase [Corynebacterium sp.]